MIDELMDPNRSIALGVLHIRRKRWTSLFSAAKRFGPKQTSRAYSRILNLDSYSLDISQVPENEDVKVYIRSQIASNPKFAQYNKNKIERQLIKGADESFRCIILQLAELDECSNVDEVIGSENFQKDWTKIYSRILDRIDKEYLADTKTFLQLLAFSLRPMTVAEIAETATVDFASSF